MSGTRCPVCGSEIEDDDLFCANCGTRLQPAQPPSESEREERQEAMSMEEQDVECEAVQERSATSERADESELVLTQVRSELGEQKEEDDEQEDAGQEEHEEANYSEVVTVPLVNENVERSLDLFLSGIEPMSDESDVEHELVEPGKGDVRSSKDVHASPLDQQQIAVGGESEDVESGQSEKEAIAEIPEKWSEQEKWKDVEVLPEMWAGDVEMLGMFAAMDEEHNRTRGGDVETVDERSSGAEVVEPEKVGEEASGESEVRSEVQARGKRQGGDAGEVQAGERVDNRQKIKEDASVLDEQVREGQWRESGFWKRYTDSWYGFTLELPASWQVSTKNGVTRVGPNIDGVEHALVRMVSLPQQVSASTVAQAWVEIMRETWSELEARLVSEESGHIAEAQRVQVLRLVGEQERTRIEGIFSVQVYEHLALISGFQAKASQLRWAASTFRNVLASFRFTDKVRRKRYIDEDERAYRGYVPIDWSVEAHLRRMPTEERTPLVDFQASDALGRGSVSVPPTYELYSEDSALNRVDAVGYRRVMSATHFIKEVLVPRYHNRRPGMQIESIARSVPGERDTKRGQGGIAIDDASVQYTYDEQGKTYREQVTVQVMHMPVFAMWVVQMVSRKHALVEHFVELEPLFAGILEARMTSGAWKQREKARVEERLREAQRMLANAGASYIQTIHILPKSSQSIAESLRASIDQTKQEAGEMTGIRAMMPILRGNQGIYERNGAGYSAPLGFEMYWKRSAETSMEEQEQFSRR
jgi:hypothetical protein